MSAAPGEERTHPVVIAAISSIVAALVSWWAVPPLAHALGIGAAAYAETAAFGIVLYVILHALIVHAENRHNTPERIRAREEARIRELRRRASDREDSAYERAMKASLARERAAEAALDVERASSDFAARYGEEPAAKR